MPDIQSLLDIIKDLGFKKFGEHLKDYSTLYTNPLLIWKKVISNRKEGFDLVIPHIIYYSIFLICILEINHEKVARLVFFEVILTIIPVLLFAVPFKLFNVIFKKRYNWIKLFRLFLILRLQFSPVINLLLLGVDFFKIDELYVIVDNVLGLILVLYIVIFPLIIHLSFWRKVIWIIGNYLTLVIELLILVVVLYKMDYIQKFLEINRKDNPNTEYVNFIYDNLYVLNTIEDDFNFILFSNTETSKYTEIRPQFVSSEFYLYFLSSELSESDSIRRYENVLLIPRKEEPINTFKHFRVTYYNHLTISEVDSFGVDLFKKINKNYKLSSTLKDSSQFESNREYFKAVYNYITVYKEYFSDSNKTQSILSSGENVGTISLGKNQFGVMFKFNNEDIRKYKKEYKAIELKLHKRYRNSILVISIVIYPIELIAENFYDFL